MRLALVAVAVLAAGCIMDQHCGPAYNDLEWTEPGLYASVSGGEPAWLKWDPGDGALPWNGTARWPGIRLASVELTLPPPPTTAQGIWRLDGPHILSIGVQRDGELVALVDGNVSEATLRSTFDQAVGNVTHSGFDREAAWSRFLASRTATGSASVLPLEGDASTYETRPHWHHSAPLLGGLDLDAMAERLDLPAPTPADVGQASAHSRGWTFTYSLPSWTLARVFSPGPGDESLRVDSGDQVMVHAGRGTASEEALRDVARGLLSILGHDSQFPGATSTSDSC